MNFITTYAVKMESTLQEMRVVVGGITFALGAQEGSSEPSLSANASPPEPRTAAPKGKEVVTVESSKELEVTKKEPGGHKLVTSTAGMEAAVVLQHLSTLRQPPTLRQCHGSSLKVNFLHHQKKLMP
jgi:hypothetical protein